MQKPAELCVRRSVFAAMPGLMLMLALTCLNVRAQSDRAAPAAEPSSRPKIGLVLSGGGARGFAHIGALEVLEAHHIPVDYLAGASMGALIGALYATGMTPVEMRELVGTLDWDQLLRGTPPYDDLSFRRREDRRNIPAPLLLRGRPNDLKLPASFNAGHEIGLLFDRLMLPYATVTDFDELPIPFRAVATDMVEGKTVILGSGSLARALRATMALPGVFTPVEIGGKILSDGGILDNIPTDVVKAMGADIIIVINIETPLNLRGALGDLAGVLGQTILVTTVENSRRSLRQADFIIAPDLATYGLADFQASSELIELGR
ncbi:MAG: patatin-like phospholipase family protein, partial [Blastocatellia bacterium]